jgi:hypothetical protein
MGHDRALLMQMGVGDLTLPNFTTRGMEASAQLLEPTASINGSARLRVFYAVDPGSFLPASQLPGFNAHNVIAIPFVRQQAADFLESKGTKLSLP